MGIWVVLVVAMAWLALAYRGYGRWLARRFGLDDTRPTPAVVHRDGHDYEPIPPRFLLGQHFSAIAAAGPIVGPILAGQYFGWAPALLWILIGSVFVGGVHDFATLVASVRHGAGSIAEVVRQHVGRRAFLLFLAFVWVALVYIIVVFTDITAGAFVDATPLEDGRSVPGGAIATASLLYLALPMAMGLALRRGLGLGLATAIFLPLIGVAIWLGPQLPFQLDTVLGVGPLAARRIWCVLLLGYCLVASLIPVWLLLQPRGHLGGMFLLGAIAVGTLGVLVGGEPVRWPAFTGWHHLSGGPLAPFLFITVACGACSGFHAIVSTGTTARQLARESDARPVAYGGMLLEGLVAVISLAFLMALAKGAPLAGKSPNFIYAQGMAGFLRHLGIPVAVGVAFGMLAFTTFVYDTLDVSTRLGRYIIEELTGWKGRFGRWFATGLTAGVPLLFVLQTSTDAAGRPVPAWKAFWGLFGASNQLLAALALLAVTVWLARERRRPWVWWVLGLPTLFMITMSGWALGRWVWQGLAGTPGLDRRLPWLAGILLVLAVVMLIEALLALRRRDATADPPAAG
jgi:carbon starvation protein